MITLSFLFLLPHLAECFYSVCSDIFADMAKAIRLSLLSCATHVFENFTILFCICREYREIDGLDTYEGEYLDDEAYEAMSPASRARAEQAMRKRDRAEALATGRTRRGLLYGR